tara:strand:- start:503 stop:1519 length:1017 start_codon:yes stop_codon:yes gene_type:complete
MKLTKILVALSFLFAVSTAHAGELAVSGSMQATYQSETDRTTGNPLGMDKELKFSGSTELDNGLTVTVMQDTDDALAFGNSLITFGGVMGMVDINIGSDGGPVDAIDDITPSAFEEANGSGSGAYNDIGGSAGQMGIGAKFSLPLLGAVNFKYVPKADATKNADKTASADTNAAVGSIQAITIKTSLGDLPLLGSYLDGATLTTGYLDHDHSTVANVDDAYDLTAALNYATGPFKFGIQKKVHNEGEGAAATTDAIFYKDTILGVAYAINDDLSVSYNRYTSQRHNPTVANLEQETDAINVGYSIGGLTIGFQEAQTDNKSWATGTDDTRTISFKAAF